MDHGNRLNVNNHWNLLGIEDDQQRLLLEQEFVKLHVSLSYGSTLNRGVSNTTVRVASSLLPWFRVQSFQDLTSTCQEI